MGQKILRLGDRGVSGSARRALVAGTALMAIFPMTSLYGQTGPAAPPTREEINRLPDQPLEERPATLSVEGGLSGAPCALADPQYRDVRFTVRSVDFGDLASASPAELEPAYREFVGSEQPVAVLCEIRDRTAEILNERGYLVAVEIPEQRLTEGNVQLRVVFARITAIRVRGDAGRSEELIAGYLRRLTEDDVFSRRAAERYLLLAGDLPGYDVRLSLRSANAGPGELIGEVAVVRTPYLVDYTVQNYGSKAIGRFGGLLRGEIYGLTGLGDRTRVALFATADFHEQKTVQIGHDFRVGSEGLSLSGDFTYSWADPDINFPGFDLESETLVATGQASYPFVRKRTATLRGGLGFDFIDQDVDINSFALSEDRVRVGFARFDYSLINAGSVSYVGGYSPAEPLWRLGGSLEFRQGFNILGSSPDCRGKLLACSAAGFTPPSDLEADPTGTLVRFSGAGEVRPTPTLAFVLGVNWQLSDDPLPNFEEFSAGNYTIGRGYDPGALLGDSGIGLSGEIRVGSIVPSGPDDFAFQPYGFFDVAWIREENPSLRKNRVDGLSSVGGGVRAIWGDRMQFDVSLAVPLERVGLQTQTGDVRVLFTLTTKLLPWRF